MRGLRTCRLVLAAALLCVFMACLTRPCFASANRITLSNDLRLVVRPDWSTEVVAIEILLDVSALDEPLGQDGIRYLTQRLLLRGTVHESGAAMAGRLAAVGGIADATVGLDYVELYALVPADGFETALELLANALRYPAFDPGEVDKQREDAGGLARAARDEAFQETYLALREGLYRQHPYGQLTLGTPSSLAAVSREDLLDFYRRHYVPGRAVIAVCGGVGQVRATRAVRRLFEDWPARPAGARTAVRVPTLTASEVVARERPLHRAHLILGFPAPAAGESDYYTTQVIDGILAGGSTARLPRRLRDELGLVYTVSSFYPTLHAPSHFGVYVVTEPYHMQRVKSAVIEELNDLMRRQVDEAELARAKSFLLGSYALSHQRMKEQAYALAWYEVLGLGVEFEGRYAQAIEGVSAEDVRETAQRLFQRFVFAITLPTT
ncbi:MAG: insulinase family protein [Armatimonadetes bacterium]|nr:insulinase family protein [Armatimonadota bacterium]